MRMNTQRILAVLLSLVLLLALAPAGWAEGGEAGAANEPVLEGSGDGGAVSLPAAGVVLTSNNSVSVNLVPSDKEKEPAFADEIKLAKVEADLYLIAPAVADPNYDTYSYNFTGSAFVSLEDRIKEALKTDPATPTTREMMLKSFTPIAQAAAEIVKTTEVKTQNEPSATTESTISVTGLPAGMYLLLLRGNDLEKNETEKGYFATTEKDGGESADSETPAEAPANTVTRALSNNYEFLFEPQLITLPTKIEGEEQAYNTAYSYNTAYGEWSENLYITAKPEMKPRYGKVKIIKTLDNYIDLSENQIKEPALFVFEITAVKPSETEGGEGTVVFKDVRGIEFKATSQESIEVDYIPAGSVVTVKEVYSGASYKAVSPLTVSGIEITAEHIAKAEFENYFNGRNGGHGIINEMKHDGKNWSSEQEGENWHE